MPQERTPTKAEARVLQWLLDQGKPCQIYDIYHAGHRSNVISKCEIEAWIDRPDGAMSMRQITPLGQATLRSVEAQGS